MTNTSKFLLIFLDILNMKVIESIREKMNFKVLFNVHSNLQMFKMLIEIEYLRLFFDNRIFSIIFLISKRFVRNTNNAIDLILKN